MIQTLFDCSDPRRREALLHDVLGEVVLKVVEEPAYENLTQLCPAMRETRTVIGLKDYPFAVGVDWDGTLNRAGYGYFTSWFLGEQIKGRSSLDVLFFKVGQPRTQFRELGWEQVSRSLLDGYLPVIDTWADYAGIEYRHTAFAHSEGMSSDRDMAVYVRFRMTNRTSQTLTGVVELCAEPEGNRLSCRTDSRSVGPSRAESVWLRISYRHSAPARAETNIGDLGKSDIEIEITEVPEQEYEKALGETRTFWQSLLAEGMGVRVPEDRVNSAYKALTILSFLNIRKISKGSRTVLAPYDGSGFYNELYGISGVSTTHAFMLTGHFGSAREYLRGILAHQRADGLFFERWGLSDNGVLLFALSQYYRLTHDRDALLEFLPAMRRLADWAITHRDVTPEKRGTMTYGLLPPDKYTADIPEKSWCYLNDVYNWKGLDEFAVALAEAGFGPEARSIREVANVYRADILTSMDMAQFPEKELFEPGEYLEGSFAWEDRAVYEKGPLTIVPMTPVSRSLERAGGGGFYYAIVAGAVLETGFFEPDHPLARRMCEFMERRGGFMLGMVSWLWQRAIDHAYTYGYLMNKIRADDVPHVLLAFYGMLAYGMSRDTFSAGEVVPLITGRGNYGQGRYGEGRFAPGARHHCQPHTYSNTQHIRLLRNMVVCEENGCLHLGFTVPRRWLEGDGRIEVSNAPTAWGKVSYSLQHASVEHRVDAEVGFAPAGQERPEGIRLRVRHPGKRPILRVQVNGQDWSRYDAETGTIELPAQAGRLNASVWY